MIMGKCLGAWQVWADSQLLSYWLWDLGIWLCFSEKNVNRENGPCLVWVVVRFGGNLCKPMNTANGTQ